MSYLGLDVGTTGCKAAVFSAEGKLLASAYREYRLISPREGWAELDSGAVCESCMDVMREAASIAGADKVAAMCVSSQGEAVTPLNKSGRIIGNGMVSSDARAAELAERWGAEFGLEKLYSITGHTAHFVFSLFKLLWLRDNSPEIWNNAGKFYCYEELIHNRLGIEPAISHPLAGRTMMFDVVKKEWSEEILEAAGLDVSRLARTLPAGAVVDVIPDAITSELGFAKGAIVVAGGHDQTCCALGAGAVSPGTAAYTIGTVECITPVQDKPKFIPGLFNGNLPTYNYTIDSMYTTVAFSITGGNLLQWFRDEFGRYEVETAKECGKSPYELIMDCMSESPAAPLTLPYFTPSGTPYFDAHTPGAVVGLRMNTGRGEILRSLLEGVTFEMRLNLEIMSAAGLGVDRLVAVGGGARSAKWMQMKADILGKPVLVSSVDEAGCFGAAMLACSAHTGEDVGELIENRVYTTGEFAPNVDYTAHYDNRFEKYKELYAVMKSFVL